MFIQSNPAETIHQNIKELTRQRLSLNLPVERV